MKKQNKFYITTPIYYVNDKPHIGHAYTTVAADVLVRWHRLLGEEVFFLTGTDEHGAKIEAAAQKNGQDAQKFVDEKTQTFKNAWQELNIKYSNFLRTTDNNHVRAVQNALQVFFDKGLIYKGNYKGLYCVSCEQYKLEDDLVDGKCPEHNIEPILMKEECYFFKLSQFEKILIEKISSDELTIEPEERKNEVLSFLRRGLKDISISRKNVKWGIVLPFDESQTVYVWVDAFLNYLTGLGWDGSTGKTPDFFPPDIQLMSKDILRVHATIWMALLLALEIPLPKKIFVHGFFTVNGQKMSKSLGNVIWPEDLVEKFGADGARYLLMSSLSYGQDGDITMERFVGKYNADLANGLGNLISRVFNLIEMNFEGKLKADSGVNLDIGDLMKDLKFFEALQRIKEKIDWGNKYIDETELWELVKTDKNKAKKVLGELLAVIVKVGESLAPFMPETSQKILQSGRAKKITKGEALFPRL